MRFHPLPSFFRSLKKLDPHKKDRVKKAIQKAVDCFEVGTLPPGLGIKKLLDDIWEIRVGLDLRVIFMWKGDLIQWGAVGDHDEIRRLLKRI